MSLRIIVIYILTASGHAHTRHETVSVAVAKNLGKTGPEEIRFLNRSIKDTNVAITQTLKAL